MADFNATLIKKIARMLESDHDGERAAAASKLTSIAKAEGKNVDEMLAIVYGGGARASEPPKPPPRGKPRYQGYSDFGFGGTDDGFDAAFRWAEQEAAAAAAKAADQARRRRACEEAEANERARAEAEAKKRASQRWQNDPADPRNKLNALGKKHGVDILDDWEREFLISIETWVGFLTPLQYDYLAKIIRKYEAFERRNAEADAFWKA